MLRYERIFTAAYDVTDWIGGGWSHFSIGRQVYSADASARVVGLDLNWNLSSQHSGFNSPSAQLQVVIGSWNGDNVTAGNWAFSRVIQAGDINEGRIVAGSQDFALNISRSYAPKVALRVEAFDGASDSRVTIVDPGPGHAWSATMALETMHFPLAVRQLDQNPYENDAGPHRFRVSLGNHGLPNGRLVDDVAFDYEVRHGTTNASDFIGTTRGRAILRAGQTHVDIDIGIANDTRVEGTESYQFAIVGFGDPTISAQILDDDRARTIGISDLTVSEGATARLQVSLSAALDRAVTLRYRTEQGTAGDGSDFRGISDGLVTIAAGQTRAFIDIATIEDSWSETVEMFNVRLTGISGNDDGLTIVRQIGTVTILDDDPQRTLVLSGTTLDPGESGTVRVTMNRAADNDVFVRYRIDGATSADFAAVAGETVIRAGQVSADIAISPLLAGRPTDARTFDIRVTAAGYGTQFDGARATIEIAEETYPPPTDYPYLDTRVTLGGTGYDIPVFSFLDWARYDSLPEFYSQNFFADGWVLPQDLPAGDAAQLIGASHLFSQMLTINDSKSFAAGFGTTLGSPSGLEAVLYSKQTVEDFIYDAYFTDNARDSVKVVLGGAMAIGGILAAPVTGGASLAFAYAGAGLFAYGAVGEIADQRVDMAWANFYLQKLKEAEAYYLSALEIYERAVSRLEQASGLGREAGLEAMIDNLSVDEGFLAEINQLLVFYYANTLLAEKIVHHVDILSARWARDELSGDIKDLLASMTTGLIGQAGLTYKYVFKGVEHVFQVSDSLALFADAAVAAANISETFGSWYSAAVPRAQRDALQAKHDSYMQAVAQEVHDAIKARFGGDFDFFPDGSALKALGAFLPDSPPPAPLALPDLQIRNLSLPDGTFEPGQSISIDYDVFNFGTGVAPISVTGIFLSTDPTIDAQDTLLAAHLAPPLVPTDASLAVARAAQLPTGLAPGDYWIGVIADHDDRQDETDEGNNTSAALRITVAAPDPTEISGEAAATLVEDTAHPVEGALRVTGGSEARRGFAPLALEDFNETHGGFWFNLNTGAWGYELDNDAPETQALRAGETAQDTLVVRSLDGTATGTIRITIMGRNDQASITGDTSAALSADPGASVSGRLRVLDPDRDEQVFATTDPVALAGTYGMFSFQSATGDWGYSAAGAAARALPHGQGGTDSLTVTSLDGTAAATIRVTITGVNDTATITGDMLGVVTEGEAASAVTGGQLVINDPDTGEAAFAALRDGVLDGTYGRFGFDAATGGWSYALDNDSATVKALVHGEVRTDTLVIESVDGTASASVVVTIQGRNSAAEISGDRAGFVVAGGGASTAGMMRITDPDAGEDGFARPDAAALRGDFGAFDFDPGTGAWAYTLAHDGAALRALPAGGEATESLVVTSLDGTASETIHVTVRGVNDAATITGDAIGLVRADDIDARIATGVIHITDPDAGEDGFARPDAAALRGDFGAFDFDPGTGAWAYTLAHDGAAVLDMAGGAEGVDTLRVTSLDGTASREIAVIVQPPGHVPPPLPDPAPALAIREIARDGPTMTFGISVDPKAVAGPVLRTLDFTLGYDPALVAHVPESGSAAFTGGAGTLVLSQSGIAAADLGAPVATFAMTLLPAAGPRTIRFELTDVAVNGAPMTDQTGADAPAFGIASAFHNLTGVIDLRAAGADAPGPEGTAVRFVEADGTTRETVTDAQGAFSFLIHDGTTGILELARAHAPAPTGPDKAPGMADMLALFRMVPGLDVQGDDLIAGDVTRDGTTDLADVLALFRHVAGVPGAPEPRYVFVDAEDDLRGIDAANVPLPEDGFAVGPVTGDTHMSFLGILGGDLRDHL